MENYFRSPSHLHTEYNSTQQAALSFFDILWRPHYWGPAESNFIMCAWLDILVFPSVCLTKLSSNSNRHIYSEIFCKIIIKTSISFAIIVVKSLRLQIIMVTFYAVKFQGHCCQARDFAPNSWLKSENSEMSLSLMPLIHSHHHILTVTLLVGTSTIK